MAGLVGRGLVGREEMGGGEEKAEEGVKETGRK